MSERALLTAEYLREVINYDPITGVFTWRTSPRLNVKAGDRAGSIKSTGHRCVTIDGRTYHAARLVWLYVTGSFPPEDIDHINLVRDDDRLSNLRPASRSQNVANTRRRRTNTSGFRGVHCRKDSGKYHARITLNGKRRCLGVYLTAEEASAAYEAAARELFGEFARVA